MLQQPEKDLISLPDFQIKYFFLVQPLQIAFIALDHLTFPVIRCIKVHKFCLITVCHKSDDAPELP